MLLTVWKFGPHDVDYDGEKYILRGLVWDFEVLMLVIKNNTVFQGVTPRRLAEIYERFRRTSYLHILGMLSMSLQNLIHR
jgi:hypothetical protein